MQQGLSVFYVMSENVNLSVFCRMLGGVFRVGMGMAEIKV